MADKPRAKKSGSRKIAGMKTRGKRSAVKKSAGNRPPGKKKSGIGANHRGGSARRQARIPTREQVLEFITDNPDLANKREIARAFGLKGQDKIPLKAILRELEDDGLVDRSRKQLNVSGELPPVGAIEITGQDGDGEVVAKPSSWRGTGNPPQIFVTFKRGETARPGERILAKLQNRTTAPIPPASCAACRIARNKFWGSIKKSDATPGFSRSNAAHGSNTPYATKMLKVPGTAISL